MSPERTKDLLTPSTFPAARPIGAGKNAAMSDLPDEAAYGRVTRPERFAPLQEFAQRLVDELVNEFDAEFHREDSTNARNWRAGEGALPRVCARPGDGGCVAVRETPFPGVVLEVGRWHSFHFPRC